MAISLKRARGSLTMILTIKPGNRLQRLGLIPSDIVRVNVPELGLANFQMTVMRAIINNDWSLTLELHEYIPGTFDDELVLPALTPRIDTPTGAFMAPASNG